MNQHKPIASLSFDLDNQWSYMKTHGDSGWESFPSYLDIVVPRVLDFLEERQLKITFFVVGQDAALKKNHAAIRSIAAAGHEIGNHSFSHEPWFHIYTTYEVDKEISLAEKEIENVTGSKPIGFRGPGYSLSKATIEILEQRGYLYDASILSTYLGPFARMYFFMTSNFSEDEKRKRSLLFGSFRDGFRSNHPYQWRNCNNQPGECLNEIPVTTVPILKIPFHVSYILYISSFSPVLALLYFRFALSMCVITRTRPSLLLHPLDFLGGDEINDLSFFPAMSLTAERKMRVVDKVLSLYSRLYNVVSLQKYIQTIQQNSRSVDVEQYFKSAKNRTTSKITYR